jgi:purine-nucleoside phosphorylase
MPSTLNLPERIQATLAAIRAVTDFEPEAALILGTGLGSMAQRLRTHHRFAYRDLPHFPVPTTEDHEGVLHLGTIGERRLAVFQGRLHVYEGFTAQEVTYPIRIAKALGVQHLLVTNIAGGLNPAQTLGEFMLIRDHINLMGVNPLIGPHDDSLGARFPDMSRPYDKELAVIARTCAQQQGLALSEGVYAAMTGPSLETAAEYRMLRILGADAIGMSTVPEIIVAAQAGLRVLGLTLISDLCDPDHLEPINLPKLFAVVGAAEPKLTALVCAVVEKMP